jgi:hypothetical protein
MARRRGTIGRREHPQPRPSGMQGTCSSAVAGDPVNQRARRFSFSRTVVSHLDAEPKFCAVASGSPVEPRRLEYPQRCAQSLLVLCGGWRDVRRWRRGADAVCRLGAPSKICCPTKTPCRSCGNPQLSVRAPPGGLPAW